MGESLSIYSQNAVVMTRKDLDDHDSVSKRINSVLKQTRRHFLGATGAGALIAGGTGSALAEDAQSDGNPSIENRVEKILEHLSLEEKAAQLGSMNADRLLKNGEVDRETARDLLGDGIGHLTRIGGEGGLPPEEAAKATNELQSILIEEGPGIPAIPHEECLSGYMGPEGTTFPQIIGLASSWDPELVHAVTGTIQKQLLSIGTAQALSPVLDVVRDLRWGRVEESFGEDPYLVAAMVSEYVSGLQGDDYNGISATLKHFAGHGATKGGKNRASLNVGPRVMREVHLFPYEAVIETANAESIMSAYHNIDGVPASASEWLLTDVLRDEWGFDGTVVSDYNSIEYLKSEQGVARTPGDAAVMALQAGVDIELPNTDAYSHLVEAVEQGELAEEILDRAVRRVLRTKVRKGLLDDPIVDAESAADPFNTEEATELTRKAARESMVLLKNDGDLLPLDDANSVAVVGPKADNEKGMLGDYTYPAHYPDQEYDFDATTPLEGIREHDRDLDVTYEQGCTTTGPSTDGFDAAAEAVSKADVGVIFVGARSAVEFSDASGEKRERPSVPTSGEGSDVTDLGLPGVQTELVQRLHKTETPLVVVPVSGKPHSIRWIAEKIPAVLYAWLPGEEGGRAIADVLFGDYNPSGRLPVSIAKTVGQQPVYYNRRPNTAHKDYVYTDSSPLYPFGYGMSYTSFEYDDFSLSADSVELSGSVTASVTVTNTGECSGHHVPQLYTHAVYPSVTQPVQELAGFERIHLKPGESKRVSFELPATRLAFYDANMDLIVEAGTYELRIGRSAADIASKQSLEITETDHVSRDERTYLSETSVN